MGATSRRLALSGARHRQPTHAGVGSAASTSAGVDSGDNSGARPRRRSASLTSGRRPRCAAAAPLASGAGARSSGSVSRHAARTPTDWVTRAADDAIRHAGEGDDAGDRARRASRPSGRVHLGNLREFLTVHFVADELRRRGVPVRHLHVWDDYDRFRKVPAGVDPSYAEHIGRPLSAVPDPWDCHAVVGRALQGAAARRPARAWASRWRRSPRPSATRPGSTASRCCSPSGTATTSRRCWPATAPRRPPPSPLSEQEAAALADSRRRRRGPPRARPSWSGSRSSRTAALRARHHHRHVLRRRDHRPRLHLRPAAHTHTTNLATQDEGKLVWKVDWPMRWAFEHVDFEPAGMDHATPGSSFTVGHELVEKVFGMPRPAWFGYGFVGFAGVQKMSSSAGGAPTAEDALRVLEAPILRWLYVRRNPKQTFDIDFGPEVVRLYDEWDALARKAADPDKRDPRCSPGSAPSATAPRARCRRRGSSYRSGCCRRSPTSPPARPSRSAGSSAVGYRTIGRRPRAAARQGDGVDQRVRRPGRPHHRARVRPTRPTLASLADAAARLAAAAARRARRRRSSSTPSRRWSTACPSWRAAWPSTTSRPTR